MHTGHTPDHHPAADPHADAEEFWEGWYRQRDRVFTGRVNPVLVEVAETTPPGTALDLGCGEGGDAVWLAGHGWRVTAVDVSGTALERTGARAAAAGVGDRVHTEQHDLAATFPEGEFDLVSAQFLQSPIDFPRDEVLRRAVRAVAPGGLLLVVEHGAVPPWGEAPEGTVFPTPQETLASLRLPAGEWRTDRLGAPTREATGPNGENGVLVDHVVAVARVMP